MRIPRAIRHAVAKALPIMLFLSGASLALPGSSPAEKSVQPQQPNDALGAFLAAPIEIADFKRAKGSSNSGSFKASPWFHKPQRQGFFYQYMLFPTPKKYSEAERLSGFSVVVYKLGREPGGYQDTGEILVGLRSRISDPDLGPADLVGRLASEVTTRFGEPFALVSDVMVYQHRGRALAVHTKDGTVAWFKYVWLSREIKAPAEVPELLLRFEW